MASPEEVCKNKVWFPSRKSANRKIRQLKQKTNKKYTSYSCDICDGWHITSKVRMSYKVRVRR